MSPATAAAPVVLVTVMTGIDGLRHYVSDEAAVAGRRAGRYDAMCGRCVSAASLTTPDGVPCPLCMRWARARDHGRRSR